ncbi:MAG: hypothetical protein WCI75_07950 [candidate division NC10 bacterium]
MPYLTLHVDGAAVVHYDPVGDGHAQPQPLLLGGVERVEDAGQALGRDALARVGDGQPDSRLGLRLGGAGFRKHHGRDVARLHTERPPAEHRLNGVGDEVAEATVEALAIHHAERQVRGQPADDADAVTFRLSLEELEDLPQNVVENHRLHVDAGGARQLHHVFKDRLHPFELAGDDPVEFLPDAGVIVVQRYELREDLNGGQGVPDVVGDARRHRSEGGQAIGAPQAILQIAHPGELCVHLVEGGGELTELVV